MTKTLDIACHCGAVHVRLSGEAAAQFYCHCDDCQATSGGAYVAIAIYAADAVSQTKGELDTWTLKTTRLGTNFVLVSIQVERICGMLSITLSDRSLPWQDQDWWT